MREFTRDASIHDLSQASSYPRKTSGQGKDQSQLFKDRFSKRDWLLAGVAFAMALLVFLLTLAPSVTGEDSGELAAAAYTLGIPHPPGYPLFVILGHAFLEVVPFGEVAYRLNLLSALLGAAAVGLAVLLARRLSGSSYGSLASGLIVAFSPIFWAQATQAEVYTLAGFLFLLTLHVFVLYLLRPEGPHVWLLSYLFGLSLTAHPSLVLMGPALAAGVLLRDRGMVRRPFDLVASLLFFLGGFSIYLYLPLRSLADPAMDWGNPETLGGFFDHLLRTQYAGLSGQAARPVVDHLLYLAHVAVFDLGVIVSALSLLGLGALFQFPGTGEWLRERHSVRRTFRAVYLLAAASLSVGLLLFIGISFQKQTIALNEVFFIPLLLLLSPAVALGIDRIGAFARKELRLLDHPGPRWALALGIPAVLFFGNYRSEDRSSSWIARDYAENLLRTLPKDAVYLPIGDHANFPLLYLTLVEGWRPDVIVADKYGYLDRPFLLRLTEKGEEVERVLRMPREEADRWVIDRAGRPVFVNSRRTIIDIPPERFLPLGLLYRVDRERRPLSKEEEDALWASYDFRNLTWDYSWKGGIRDISSDFIQAEVLFHRAEYCFSRKLDKEALEIAGDLRSVGEGYKELLQNVGSLLSEKDHVEEARAFYEEALRVDPRYVECRRNYARVLLHRGLDPQKAIELSERSLLEMEPDPQFLKDLARTYRRLGRTTNALDTLEVASRLDPADPEPSRMEGEILESIGQRESALARYARSLELRGSQPELIERVHGREARIRYEAEAKKVMEDLLGPDIPSVAAGAVIGTDLPAHLSHDHSEEVSEENQ